ncbi:MAG: hypothetical protein C4538_10460 [Nitrospiraceae bacterium]|nr:MAG: hypothetical protein C4538_10460 [Nitrospiraceae bacterium]
MPKKAVVAVPRDYLAALEKKVQDLSTLIEDSAIISSTLDFNKLLTLVMEKAEKVMNAEACSILLYNRGTNKLEFEVAVRSKSNVENIKREGRP